MRNFVLGIAGAVTMLTLAMMPAAGQTYRAPRAPDGHPDLNGIWQAINTAEWDLEAHAAQQSLVVEAGTLLAEPGVKLTVKEMRNDDRKGQ